MSEESKLVLAACLALVGGLILLMVSEYLKLFVIQPIQKMREQIQVVLSRIDFHCNMLTNFFSSNPRDEERANINIIKKELREAATDLNSKYAMVPFKGAMSALKLVPSPDKIDIAYKGLITLHNSILYEGRREYISNQIDMNDNNLERIRSALTYKDVPLQLKPEISKRL